MSGTLITLGVIAASLLAGGAILASGERARAVCALLALVLTPALLAIDIWDTPQIESIRERPAVAGAGLAAGLVAVCALAVVFRSRPWLLAVLAVATLPFRIPIEAGGSTANLLVPLYAVLGAGVLAWAVPRALLDRPAPRPARANGWLERLLVAAVVLYAVQASYSDAQEKALQQVVFFYVPFTLLFVVLREIEWDRELARRCLYVLAGLAAVFVAIGFWEYQARELLLNPKIITSNQIEEYFRVNSLFFDPNIYGRFLALVMLALAGTLIYARSAKPVYWATAGLVLLWAGLVLTFSQSSFAALLAGLVVLAALKWQPGRMLGAAVALLVVAAAVVVITPGTFRLDLSSSESIDKATSGRAKLMEGGLELAADRPVHGWGAGSFERQYRLQDKTSSERAVAASHTIPITIGAEQGAVGLGAYLALLAFAFARVFRGAAARVERAVIAAALVALVVHTMLYAAFLEDPLLWVLLAAGTALAAAPRPLRTPTDDGDPLAPPDDGDAADALRRLREQQASRVPAAPQASGGGPFAA